jgi:hypothetical protein
MVLKCKSYNSNWNYPKVKGLYGSEKDLGFIFLLEIRRWNISMGMDQVYDVVHDSQWISSMRVVEI